MTVRRLAAVDAQTHWMARAIPSDQFLLYGFDAAATDLDRTLATIADRARRCPDLRLRVAETSFWTYPVWEPRDVDSDQFGIREPVSWPECLTAVASLADAQLDATVSTWRLHVFPSVGEMPIAGAGTVVVLQISHALGDGIRASALAAYLFGRDSSIPAAGSPRGRAHLPRRALAAARAHRRLVRDTDAGLVPPQADSRPALRSNARPSGRRYLRTVIRRRMHLPGPTVTVGALTAVSAALAGHLRELGDDPALLGAEVPMARAGPRRANNHFGNVGVGLYPELDAGARASRIALDLSERRRRAAHPAMAAEDAAFGAVPAPLLRWGVSHFDPDVRSATVTGNTVVSSVNRGTADLRFGAAQVVLTAGYPSLSPMMGLTHGVHGVGDTIAVSVHAAESAIGDIDAYVARLEHELA
ncbi:hypothetical protein Mycch_4005 [Mycolicibacterium chubuense NBB4]|uniref:O-acyltransferase WSD1 C-terminal domain-containing protein n=1 Tax=Mycolicibacterium chubuense (strain NBB4) TaxID=710421 RepID=I4BN71_MYCCN|nr:hypothetical protein [Mycolicibacterium chubuense]AFM18728.1 hypothetical protein Mycch_4005 [Mycolicibacterium chubuense NBB4]